MTTSPEDTNDALAGAERILLRALCHSGTPRSLLSEILQRAEGHAFREARHQIVFRALREIGLHGSPGLEPHLAAHLTRLGFPDIDVEELFAGAAPTEAEIRAALGRLAGAGPAKT